MISVIIPNYNHAFFLSQRIDSVLSQTYQNFELIILDDYSSDNSRDIIEEYRNHPKISHIIYNSHNSGSTFKQWEKGIQFAKGEYIWIAESDDYADSNLLEILYEKIKKTDNCVVSYCQSYRMNAASEIMGTWQDQVRTFDGGYSFFSNDFVCNGTEFIDKFLLDKNVIPNASAVLFSKDVYHKVGGVDLDIKACADWLFWLKLLTKGNVSFTSQVLNYFRFHERSVIASATRSGLIFLKSKYDIIARKKYNKFLEKKHADHLIQKNTDFIERDYVADVFECYYAKAYIKSIKMFFLAFFYSKNKRKLTSKTVNFLLKRR